MHELLAQAYGTARPAEDAEKVAQVQFFAKLAADNGIDLSQVSDTEIQDLWGTFQTKLAEDAEKDDKGDKKPHPFAKKDEEKKDEKDEKKPNPFEKKEAAAQEFAAIKEAESKVAEADYLGRVMAHAFAQESEKIAQAKEAAATAAPADPTKVAAATKVASKKEVSALDQSAAEQAVIKAAAAGFDGDEAAERVAAILVLGPADSTKVAAAQDVDTATGIRALELLEQAGYPVTWETA